MAEKLFSYIKIPVFLNTKDNISVKMFFNLLLLFYLLLLPCSVLIVVLQAIEALPYNKINDLNSSLDSLAYVVLLAPLLEELIFRLPLKMSKITFSISLSVFLILIIRLLIFQSDHYAEYLLAIPVFSVVYGILLLKNGLYSKIKTFWVNHFRFIFYLSSIIFGISHLFNIEQLNWWMILVSPLITFPYIVMGLF